MKRFILITLLITLMGSCVGIRKTPNTSIPLQKFEVQTNLTQEENFDMINTWFVKSSFKRPEYIIQYSNKKSGVVSGKFIVKLDYIEHYYPKNPRRDDFTLDRISFVDVFVVIRNFDNTVMVQFEVSEIINNESLLSAYNNYIISLIEDIYEYSLSF